MEVAVSFCACGCGKVVSYGRWFRGHKPKRINKTHDERSEIARRMWDERGRKPLELHQCACGCGEMVRGKWKHGHHSRVSNISKRDDVRVMRSEHFKRLHREGVYEKSWNKGLSKETDKRVAGYGKKQSENVTVEKRQKHSIGMRELWELGKIVPLTGSNHSQWNGGTSHLTLRLRGSTELYEKWKRPILIRDGFRCVACGGSGELNVHHDGERFSEVLHRFMPDDLHEMTWDEQTDVLEKMIRYHVEAPVSGITLCLSCHEHVHMQ